MHGETLKLLILVSFRVSTVSNKESVTTRKYAYY